MVVAHALADERWALEAKLQVDQQQLLVQQPPPPPPPLQQQQQSPSEAGAVGDVLGTHAATASAAVVSATALFGGGGSPAPLAHPAVAAASLFRAPARAAVAAAHTLHNRVAAALFVTRSPKPTAF